MPRPSPSLIRDAAPARGRGRLRHLGGFALAGAAGFAVDAAVLSSGVALGLPPALARVPSFLAAVATTWRLNRAVTFRTSTPPSVREFAAFVAAMSLGLAINGGVFLLVLALSDTARAAPVLALVPATATGMLANFVTARRILDR